MFWGLGRRVVEVRVQGPKLLGKSFGAHILLGAVRDLNDSDSRLRVEGLGV